MNIFKEDDYKHVIRKAVKKKRQKVQSFTLQKLSAQIPIQYTYLSKVLNDEQTHLNEDHIFKIAQILDLSDNETDYFLLLRSLATATNENRKIFLLNKLESLQQEKALEAQQMQALQNKLSDEMKYLFDPLCIIVHLSLHLDNIKDRPQNLCYLLQVSEERLKNILLTLENNNFVTLDSQNPYRIKKLHAGHFHYGKEHPLMRTHQNILKSSIPSKLQQTDERHKHSFLATFTLDEPEFEKIKSEFKSFIKKVEGIVKNSPQKGVYQLNFDLFRYF